MLRRVPSLLAMCSCLVAMACSEVEKIPPAPSFSVSSSSSCNFIGIKIRISEYLDHDDVTAATALINSMQSAHDAGDVAFTRDRGFEVMALIAAAANAGTAVGLAATGSDVTNRLLACMFLGPEELPDPFPADFTASLEPGGDGAYAVRTPHDEVDTPILARASEFSGIAPPDGLTWAEILSEPVLIYGAHGEGDAYEWSMVPRDATFTPGAVVGLCVTGSGAMVLEENLGILAYVNPDYFLLCPGLVGAATVPAASTWLGRLARGITAWVGPKPLLAEPAFLFGGVGGLAGGLRSLFEVTDVQATGGVVLAFTTQPLDGLKDQLLSTVRVRATNADGVPIAGVSITLSAVRNNGQPAELLGTITRVTGPDGFATFSDLSITKTGAYRYLTDADVVGRPAINVPVVESQKFNIRPH